MIKNSNAAATVTLPSDTEIHIERWFNAPRALVFKAMTDPQAILHWWGRKDDVTTVDQMDVHPGGKWRFISKGTDGVEHAFRGEFREVIPVERVVQTFEYEPYPGHISVETMTLDEIDGRTKMTVVSRFDSKEERDAMIQSGMETGMNETYARLDNYLTQENIERRALVITRIFDAPRELVWKAWTDPDYVMRWWGPEHFTSPLAKIDLRVGGKYLFAMRDPEGKDYYSTGVFQKLEPPRELVYTDSFSDEHGNVVSPSAYGMTDFPEATTVTVLLEDIGGGKTRLTLINSGVPAGELREMSNAGWNQSFDKLAASLK